MDAFRPAQRDPVLEALDGAPLVRSLSAEQRAELEEDVRQITEGRAELVGHEDVPRVLEELAGGS